MNTLIKQLNDLVMEAIIHGGDVGGPYLVNEKNLVEAMQKIKETLQLKETVGLTFIPEFASAIPQFVQEENFND